MTRIGKSFCVYVCFILLAEFANAKVSVAARPDRDEMGLGDTISIYLTVTTTENEEIGEPKLPSLDGFQLVDSGQSQSSSMKLEVINGAMNYTKSTVYEFSYRLAAQRVGTLKVDSIEVPAGGKTYLSKPFQIRVLKEGSGAALPNRRAPQLPGLPPEDEVEDLFNQFLQRRMSPPSAGGKQAIPKNLNESFSVQVEADKTEVFEGEQVLVNWYIFTRGNILSLDRLKFPDLKGFWKEIIEEVPSLTFTQEVINGVPYKKALLASHALFPIKPGTAVVDEFKIRAMVQVPDAMFGSFAMGKPYSFNRASERVSIKVKPLPVEGKPSSFSGAVGQFEPRAWVDGNQFPTNEPFTLRLRFEGNGNAKLIELPPLNLPAQFEQYSSRADSKFFKNGRSLKEFEILLIPRAEGDWTIPSFEFSYFDTEAKKYFTKKTEPIQLKILKGSTMVAQGQNFSGPAEKKTEAQVLALPPLQTSWQASESQSFVPLRLFWWAVFAFISFGLFLYARVQFGWGVKKRTLRELMDKRMKKVEAAAKKGDFRSVGVEMTNLIYLVLGKISGLGGASQELGKLLEAAPPSLRVELGSEIQSQIDLYQSLGFAPEAVIGKYKEPDQMISAVAKTSSILKRAIEVAEAE